MGDRHNCEYCNGEDDLPCCYNGRCEAPKGARGITNCICCGGELHELDGCWYHWSQFEADGGINLSYVHDIVDYQIMDSTEIKATMLNRLEDYLNNSPIEKLKDDWRQIEKMNLDSPNALQYIEFLKVSKCSKEDLHNIFKKWCKETKRGGGILIGSSVREFLDYLQKEIYE